MKNRFALGWAPGRPKTRFIKAVSGGLVFLLVSQRIRCKARKNWKTSRLGPFFSTARPPAGFLSFYLINWMASISNLNIVDLGQKSRQKMDRFSAIFRFPIPAAQNHCVSFKFRKELAAATARPSERMKNRFALGWAPGRPKANFIKAVSGGLVFLWVSQEDSLQGS